MSIFLERRIVKILNRYNIKNETGFSHKDFITHLSKDKLWLLINYPFDFYNEIQFYRTLEIVVNDCMCHGYLKNDNAKLVVTMSGRDFTRFPGGFFEEYRKRRQRWFEFWTVGLGGVVLGSVVTWFINK